MINLRTKQPPTATTAAHRANNIIISSHHQVTARSRSVMNVKLTSFSLSRCKMIVPSKSRPGLGVRLHLSRVLDPSIGGHHLQYLHYTALPTLCQAGKRISAQQTENSFMRPRILSGPWAVGLNIFDHISINIYVSKYLNIYIHSYICVSITPYLRWIEGLTAPPLQRGAVDMSGGMQRYQYCRRAQPGQGRYIYC